MRTFEFDVKMFASVTVEADSEAHARRLIDDHINGAEVNAGAWSNGDPILFSVSTDGEHYLFEVCDPDGSVERPSGGAAR